MNSPAEAGSSKQNKSIFISAGEPSGEMHGSALIKELRLSCKDFKLEISGLGGEMMKAEGAKLLYHTDSLAAVGLLDVAKKYSFFKKVLKDCTEYVKEHNPDAVVLIDYPGFNLRFAEAIRKFYTGKIIYYISPQLWAWHEKRVEKIKKYIDKMLVVFPFEVEFYKKFGVNAEYVGHPLVKRIDDFLSEHKKENRSAGTKKIVTLLAGSRNNEIKNHLPVLLKTIKKLSAELELKVLISKAPSVNEKSFEPYLKDIGKYELTSKSSYELMLSSDLVMSKAGTSTLECALVGTPNFVFLKTAPINYFLLKPLVKINNIALINIIAGEEIVKEFIQKDFNAQNLYIESKKILTDKGYSNLLAENLKKVREILGNNNASLNAALLIKQMALV